MSNSTHSRDINFAVDSISLSVEPLGLSVPPNSKLGTGHTGPLWLPVPGDVRAPRLGKMRSVRYGRWRCTRISGTLPRSVVAYDYMHVICTITSCAYAHMYAMHVCSNAHGIMCIWFVHMCAALTWYVSHHVCAFIYLHESTPYSSVRAIAAKIVRTMHGENTEATKIAYTNRAYYCSPVYIILPFLFVFPSFSFLNMWFQSLWSLTYSCVDFSLPFLKLVIGKHNLLSL